MPQVRLSAWDLRALANAWGTNRAEPNAKPDVGRARCCVVRVEARQIAGEPNARLEQISIGRLVGEGSGRLHRLVLCLERSCTTHLVAVVYEPWLHGANRATERFETWAQNGRKLLRRAGGYATAEGQSREGSWSSHWHVCGSDFSGHQGSSVGPQSLTTWELSTFSFIPGLPRSA